MKFYKRIKTVSTSDEMMIHTFEFLYIFCVFFGSVTQPNKQRFAIYLKYITSHTYIEKKSIRTDMERIFDKRETFQISLLKYHNCESDSILNTEIHKDQQRICTMLWKLFDSSDNRRLVSIFCSFPILKRILKWCVLKQLNHMQRRSLLWSFCKSHTLST